MLTKPINYKVAAYSSVSHQGEQVEIFAVIMGSLGGVAAVLTVLIAYFGNLRLERYKSDLQLANAKIQSLSDTSSHISKTQFDKEFTIYQEIWVFW